MRALVIIAAIVLVPVSLICLWIAGQIVYHETIWRWFYRDRDTAAILAALADGPKSGFEVMRMARIGATAYVVLMNLEGEGRIESDWESPYELPDRPRRRIYRLKEAGA